MKTKFLKTLCLALAAATCVPATAGVPARLFTTVAKTAEEGANALPGLVNAGGKINAGVTALSNAKNVAAAVKKTNGEIKTKSAGFDKTVGGKKPTGVRYAAENVSPDMTIKMPAGNPLNLVTNFSEYPGFSHYDYPIIRPVGYEPGEAPAGYWEEYQRVLTNFVDDSQRYHGKQVILVASPLLNEGGVDLVATKVAQQKNVFLTYIVADRDVPKIDLDNLPEGVDKAKYAAVEKYVVKPWEAYEANENVPNVTLVVGGGEEAVIAAMRALKNDKQVIVVDDPKLGPVNWNAEKGEPGNAAAYIIEQIRAFKAGKKLPYPPAGELNKEFLERIEYKINCGFIRAAKPEDIHFYDEDHGMYTMLDDSSGW